MNYYQCYTKLKSAGEPFKMRYKLQPECKQKAKYMKD